MTPVFYSEDHVLFAGGISARPKNVEKLRVWPTATNVKEVHSLLGFASYYCRFILKFAQMAYCINKLVGPTSKKIRKGKDQKKEKTVSVPNQTEEKISNGCQCSVPCLIEDNTNV